MKLCNSTLLQKEMIGFCFPQDQLIEPTFYPSVLGTQGFPPGLVEGLGRIARELNLKVQIWY